MIDLSVLEKVVRITEPLFEHLVESERQAKTPTQLRDTLLSRLISGQLRLPGAVQEAEALA